jgi:hypothetical protein
MIILVYIYIYPATPVSDKDIYIVPTKPGSQASIIVYQYPQIQNEKFHHKILSQRLTLTLTEQHSAVFLGILVPRLQ